MSRRRWLVFAIDMAFVVPLALLLNTWEMFLAITWVFVHEWFAVRTDRAGRWEHTMHWNKTGTTVRWTGNDDGVDFADKLRATFGEEDA